MPKVLILDGLSEEGIGIFRQAEGFEVDVKPPQKPDELAAIIGDYDGLVVRSATKVTAEAIKHAKRLKVIGRAGAGTDNIDKDAATKRGIVVMNTPGGNTISTCEHAFALMFALLRNIPQAHRSMDEGRWDRKKFMGSEVCGKTLGIVGVGRIGAAVAKRAQAFEMKVIAFDPILNKVKADALGVELVSIEELIERADIITIHAPKSDKTMNMIAAEQLAKMKPNCRIVNCARGGIVNEADLAEALRNRTIAGAALDVYTSEPFANNPFIGLDNIVTTPHLAASTDEAQLTVAVDIAKQMVD
ncbi:MAG: D-3-phosphoglycerate dehydrogenase, partial [Candidatus Hydrogenedentes bacterium]|nr:D-3-phosphoglycerate dehydrogenase [Candidatus Hydrogenedentota bacterium]